MSHTHPQTNTHAHARTHTHARTRVMTIVINTKDILNWFASSASLCFSIIIWFGKGKCVARQFLLKVFDSLVKIFHHTRAVCPHLHSSHGLRRPHREQLPEPGAPLLHCSLQKYIAQLLPASHTRTHARTPESPTAIRTILWTPARRSHCVF